ncbi:MAG: hypothetical protein LUC34_01860 [Campylobacter sp.]|nr:hypothetical protein [Campylobacter sp.]
MLKLSSVTSKTLLTIGATAVLNSLAFGAEYTINNRSEVATYFDVTDDAITLKDAYRSDDLTLNVKVSERLDKNLPDDAKVVIDIGEHDLEIKNLNPLTDDNLFTGGSESQVEFDNPDIKAKNITLNRTSLILGTSETVKADTLTMIGNDKSRDELAVAANAAATIDVKDFKASNMRVLVGNYTPSQYGEYNNQGITITGDANVLNSTFFNMETSVQKAKKRYSPFKSK